MVFPFHFGFFQGTKGGDGDPLDVLILLEGKAWPGVELEVQIIGGFSALQSAKKKTVRNDRIIAVAVESALYAQVNSVGDLNEELLNQLKGFFVNYNRLEGKEFNIEEQLSMEKAMKVYKKARSG